MPSQGNPLHRSSTRSKTTVELILTSHRFFVSSWLIMVGGGPRLMNSQFTVTR